jgi:hypothetical protein
MSIVVASLVGDDRKYTGVAGMSARDSRNDLTVTARQRGRLSETPVPIVWDFVRLVRLASCLARKSVPCSSVFGAIPWFDICDGKRTTEHTEHTERTGE